MIRYKYQDFLTQVNAELFDRIFEPGERTVFSGIYRCPGCGNAITSVAGNTLPPQNHHEHTPQQGKIRWQLAVWT